MSTQRHHLDVPGASIYYEVRGSGPLLLVVAQPMTSEPFGPTADLPGRRPHGRDVRSARTWPEHGGRPVAVDHARGRGRRPGPHHRRGRRRSGGRLRHQRGCGRRPGARRHHPAKVRTLIAHEPPVTELVEDAPHIRAAVDEVEDAYEQYGSGAGWGKFVSLVMHDGLVPETGPAPATWPPPGQADRDPSAEQPAPEPNPKQEADDALFFLRMLKPFTRYEPRMEALRSGAPRVVVAVGRGSGEEIAKRSTAALAERLGTDAAVFPGDHGGFMADRPVSPRRSARCWPRPPEDPERRRAANDQRTRARGRSDARDGSRTRG